MALKNSQYDTIMRQYQQQQLKNRQLQENHIQEIQKRIPRIKEIDGEIASLSIQKAKQLLGLDRSSPFDLRQAIRDLGEERTCLLQAHGYPADYMELHYKCSKCQDTGWDQTRGKKCSCFQKASIDLLYSQSNMKEILLEENFNTFSLDYYSDQERDKDGHSALEYASRALEISKAFVRNFDKHFENLFIFGPTGTGKTFLSHCIAKELIDSVHSVIYFTSYELIALFENRKFNRWDEETDSIDHIFDCDLLIIDDLGTELNNSFVTSQLFLCINERMMRKKSTVISTNISLAILRENYSERVFSRVTSTYTLIKLFGTDIRVKKRLKGGY